MLVMSIISTIFTGLVKIDELSVKAFLRTGALRLHMIVRNDSLYPGSLWSDLLHWGRIEAY